MKIAIVASSLFAMHQTVTRAEEFSYDPNNALGPANWDQVDVPNNACGGSSQSGIDIPTTPCSVYDQYTFQPGTCTIGDLTFKMSDHSIQADYPTDGTCEPPSMRIPGQNATLWQASQFHFHAGSDHAMNGVTYGADFHLVHKEVGGTRLAVVGLFVNPGSPTNTGVFDDVLSGWEGVAAKTQQQCNLSPTTTAQALAAGNEFNPYGLLPANYSMYTYAGSLTTPPCSEIVSWNVVDTPLLISIRDYRRLVGLVLDFVSPDTCQPGTVASPAGSTGRPLNPLNGRVIQRHCQAKFGPSPIEVLPVPTTPQPTMCPTNDRCTTNEGVVGRYLNRTRSGRCQMSCIPLGRVAAKLLPPTPPASYNSQWKCGKCPKNN